MLPHLTSTLGPDELAVAIPLWLDLAAVVVGSFSGLLYAQRRSLDLVGHIGLAIICGLGGGLIRDTIMQVGDVYMLNSPWAIWLCVATACAGFLFPGLMTHFPHLLEWVDILAVALFAAAGTDKAIMYGLGLAQVLLMGTMTSVGGGMMRDVHLSTVKLLRYLRHCGFCGLLGKRERPDRQDVGRGHLRCGDGWPAQVVAFKRRLHAHRRQPCAHSQALLQASRQVGISSELLALLRKASQEAGLGLLVVGWSSMRPNLLR